MLAWLPNQKLPPAPARAPSRNSPQDRRIGLLYAALIALATFIPNGTSTHLPEFIAAHGLPVTIGILWGVGQTGARFLEVASGSRLTPLRLTLFTTLLIPFCFMLGICSTHLAWAAAGFVFSYGALNGLTTVFKATLPLQLFSAEEYARRTGSLLIPAQLLAAVSPFAYAWLNQNRGIQGALTVSATLALIAAGLAVSVAICQASRLKNDAENHAYRQG